MPTDTFASFAKRVDAFATGLKDPHLRQVMTKIGVEAKGDAVPVVAADLGGDDRFSGWAKAPLATRFQHAGPGRIAFGPTKRSAGPWTVAERGRDSPRNGRTRGKGTATRALAVIERETPARLEREIDRAIRKSFD
jgi:hypothetical protein